MARTGRARAIRSRVAYRVPRATRTRGRRCACAVARLAEVSSRRPESLHRSSTSSVGSQERFEAGAEASAGALESLADRGRIGSDGLSDLARIQLGAVAQAHNHPIAPRQFRERNEERAPLPQAVETVCRIDALVGYLGELTGGG